MNKIFLYNTLSREKEEFKSINDRFVGLYTCGPTVYNYAHIGNLRAYIFEDLLKRTLLYNGYEVSHVMNITDVGHLVGDMDMGEDKMETGAKREGKSVFDISEMYTQAFKNDLNKLNIKEPNVWAKVTDNIKEQIDLIKVLEEKGFAYKISDGIYFDTSKVKDYNKLSHLPLDQLKEGARVEKNEEKRNPTDFALWKFSPKDVKRQMEWESPWGIGFPGWHIECSAISLKYISEALDIHCGGFDHINVHHTNEIAQSEAATGKKFFNFWLHNAFLNIKGGKKMAKSGDNFLTLENSFIKKGYNPLAYKFLVLQTHYRKPMEYNDEIARQADEAYKSLEKQIVKLFNAEIGKVDEKLKQEFILAINDDLNSSKALAVLFKALKSKISDSDKRATVLDFDRVLGFGFENISNVYSDEIPKEVEDLFKEREDARIKKDWEKADDLRAKIEKMGYFVEDTSEGSKISKN